MATRRRKKDRESPTVGVQPVRFVFDARKLPAGFDWFTAEFPLDELRVAAWNPLDLQ